MFCSENLFVLKFVTLLKIDETFMKNIYTCAKESICIQI